MRMPCVVALFASMALGMGGRDARADGAAARRPPPEPGWYGWQIAAIDALGAALMITGYERTVSAEPCDCEEMGSGYLMLFGLYAYASSGPMLHRDHRRHGALVGSAALRVGLPLAAGLYAHARDPDDGWTAVAVLAGAGLASAIDVGLLSHDRRPRPPPAATPILAPVPGGATAGVSVRF